MASDWIKIEMSTPDKSEVMHISRGLKLDRDTIVGKLVRLWSWFDQNSTDGVVRGVVDADVDAIASQENFARELRAVNWLLTPADGNGIMMPNFERHNGKSSKKRALKSRRQQNWREGNVDAPPSTHASTRRDESSTPSRTRKSRAPGTKLNGESKSAQVWAAYSNAFFNRYGVEPVRNAAVNSQLSKLIDRLGATEAPSVAAFYVTHNKAFYVGANHSTAVLLRDAEGLRKEWATGNQTTETQARRLDQGQAQGSVWAKLKAEGEKKLL